MASLKFCNINKIYDNSFQAVFDFNLEIKDKEFIVFVGPSGCGKSTTLRMVAGLEDISSGELYIDDKLVNDVLPKDRDIAMVFQNYALYPHMTVYDNMAFGLKLRNVSKDIIDQKVTEAAKILGLTQYLRRKPKALSGGQRQRVALGRAIVRSPKVFLMDEPLSNLDAKLRVQMRSEIAKIHKKVNATTIYVTHDQTEAMTMADRIVIMKDGYIQQTGTPKELYLTPANIFVAGFIGSPAMNFFDVDYDGENIILGDTKIKLDKETIKAHDNFYKENVEKLKVLVEEKQKIVDERIEEIKDHFSKEISAGKTVESIEDKDEFYQEYYANLKFAQNRLESAEKAFEESKSTHKLTMGIRPEDIYLNGDMLNKNPSADFKLEVTVSELLGAESIIYGDIIPDHQIILKVDATEDIKVGETISLCFNMNRLHLFDTETTTRIK